MFLRWPLRKLELITKLHSPDKVQTQQLSLLVKAILLTKNDLFSINVLFS